MTERIEADICVIGAGSGGLSVAAGASQMGAKTVLFEAHKMGGDCLNFGCVPSKALLAAGKTAQTMRHADRFGIGAVADPKVDFQAVHDHVHAVIAAIEPNDSVERFEGLGVTVVQARARFTGPQEVTGGDTVVSARRIVVATGSGPFVPPIPGLDQTPHFTNETIFDRTELPEHLIVVGGGPIGCELAQAHRHLGARVTVLEMAGIMPNDDPELVDVVRQRLLAEGLDVVEQAKVTKAAKTDGGVAVTYEKDGAEQVAEGSHLLIAVGRRPNLDGLNLEAAGVEYSPRGIKVDARLRTTNRKVFAIGDAAGGYQFTHVAGYHAGVVIKNALFRLPSKVDYKAVPWVTYTEPELAHVGLAEKAAREKHGDIKVLRWPYHENDRAQAEHAIDGLVKVVIDRKGRILGATIVGAHAGELIQVWCLAISTGQKIGAVANMIAPYPTLGEVAKRAAGSYYTPMLFSDRTRRIVRFLARFG